MTEMIGAVLIITIVIGIIILGDYLPDNRFDAVDTVSKWFSSEETQETTIPPEVHTGPNNANITVEPNSTPNTPAAEPNGTVVGDLNQTLEDKITSIPVVCGSVHWENKTEEELNYLCKKIVHTMQNKTDLNLTGYEFDLTNLGVLEGNYNYTEPFQIKENCGIAIELDSDKFKPNSGGIHGLGGQWWMRIYVGDRSEDSILWVAMNEFGESPLDDHNINGTNYECEGVDHISVMNPNCVSERIMTFNPKEKEVMENAIKSLAEYSKKCR